MSIYDYIIYVDGGHLELSKYGCHNQSRVEKSFINVFFMSTKLNEVILYVFMVLLLLIFRLVIITDAI